MRSNSCNASAYRAAGTPGTVLINIASYIASQRAAAQSAGQPQSAKRAAQTRCGGAMTQDTRSRDVSSMLRASAMLEGCPATETASGRLVTMPPVVLAQSYPTVASDA